MSECTVQSFVKDIKGSLVDTTYFVFTMKLINKLRCFNIVHRTETNEQTGVTIAVSYSNVQ